MTQKKKRSPWLISLGVLAFLAALIFVVLPLGIKYSLSQWLLSRGADSATISRVRLNPFLGTMALEGVTVKMGGATVLADSDIEVDIGMLSLLKKEAVLQKSTLIGVTLDLELYDDGRMRIGSYTTSPDNEDKTEESSNASWLFAANQVDLQDCTIHFKMTDLDLTLHVDKANLVKFTTAPGDKSGRFFLRGTVNDTPVELDLDTLRVLPDIVIGGTVKVDEFALDNLAELLKPTLTPFTGQASIDGKVAFSMNDLGDIRVDYDGMLAVARGDIGGSSFRVKALPVRWQQGTIHFAMTEQDGIDIDVNGRLTGDKVSVALPGPQMNIDGPKVDIHGRVKVVIDDQVRVDSQAALILDQPALTMDSLTIKAKQLAWQGDSPRVRFSSGTQQEPLSVTANGTFLAKNYAISQQAAPQGPAMSTSGELLSYVGSAAYSIGADNNAAARIKTDGTLTGNNIGLVLAETMELHQQFIEHRGKADLSLKSNTVLLTLHDSLQGNDLTLHLPAQEFTIKQQKFNSTHRGTITLADAFALQGSISAGTNGLTIMQKGQDAPLLTLEAFTIEKAEAPSKNQISAESISSKNLVYHLGGDMPLTISLPAITISNLTSDDLASWQIGKVIAQGPEAISARSRDRLAGLDTLEVRSISVNQNMAINIDRILFDDLFFLKPAANPKQQICSIGGARLSNIGWQTDKGLSASSLSFADLFCDIVRNKDGSLILANQLAKMRIADTSAQKSVQKKEKEKTLPIRLDKVTLQGKSGLHFEDHTLAIPFTSNVAINTFQVEKLDSGHPDEPASVRLKAVLEKRAPLSVKGTIKPFADPLAMHLQLVLKNYPLNHLSAYTVQSVGVALASGSLRINSDIKLADNKLDMHNTVLLKQLKTSTISKELADKLDNQLPIPLDSALSMLKDRDDTIKLDVPISGPLDKLNVGISDILITALGKAIVPAASGYLVYALGPYGALAWVGMELGSRMMAVKLPPVFFAPGKTDLPDTVDDYFSRLAKILQDKPEADFRLCPKSSAWELRQDKEKDKEKETWKLSPETEKQLKELGQQRAARIKEYLEDKFGVDGSRLLICTTEIEKKKSAKPQVEIRM